MNIFILAIFVSISFAQQIHKPKAVLFGDSITDSGKTFNWLKSLPLNLGQKHIDQNHFSSPGYCKGRLSNGPTWYEYLFERIEWDVENNAYAGSKLQNHLLSPQVKSITNKIEEYSKANPSPKDLQFIWAGSNDYLDYYWYDKNVIISREQQDEIIDETISNLIELARKSVKDNLSKDIIITNLPPIHKTPFFQSRSPSEKAAMLRMYHLHNEKLTKAIEDLKNESSTFKKVHLLPISSIMEKGLSQFESYQFKNVNDCCHFDACSDLDIKNKNLSKQITKENECNDPTKEITAFSKYIDSITKKLSYCSTPDDYFFWDGVHPTTKAHCLLSFQVESFLIQEKIIPDNGQLGRGQQVAYCSNKKCSERLN